MRKRESGFTLVELLVVILIVGILAAVAIPAFMNQRQRANVAALESDMKNVATAMETWLSNPKNKAGELPTPTELSGWSLIFRHDDFTPFPGDSPNSYPGRDYSQEPTVPLLSQTVPGFPDVTVSEGVGVGIVSGTRAMRDKYGDVGYCIAGSVKNSPYDITKAGAAGEPFLYAMFYDPVLGGLFTAEDLPADGACAYYRTRIDAAL